MFTTIVWATDGSEFADDALPLVTDLARTFGARIVAVHANEILRGRFGGAPVLADENELRTKVRRQVAELQDAGFAAKLTVETSGAHGTPELIADAAREEKADLIVLTTHGYGLLRPSVARGLLHVAPCPVLAVPPALATEQERETRLAGAVTT